VGLPWPAARHPPSPSLTLPPQQDRGENTTAGLGCRDEVRGAAHQLTVMAKTDSAWGK